MNTDAKQNTDASEGFGCSASEIDNRIPMLKTFGDRVRFVIGSEQWTPWAVRHGIAPSTVDGWLHKGVGPYKKTLAKLEEATGIPAEWWKSGEGPPPRRVGQGGDTPVDAIAMSPDRREALNRPFAQVPSRQTPGVKPMAGGEGAEDGAQESPEVASAVAPQQADPTDADRRMMFLSLLRTMEHHLQAPVPRERAELMLQVVAAWSEFAAAAPELRARLEAVRVAACLYLDASLDRTPK